MAAIDLMHRTKCYVVLSSGDTSGGSLQTDLLVVDPGGGASVMGTPLLGLSGAYPCKEHLTLQACVFAGLYKLDGEISRRLYKQSELDT